MTRRRSPKRTGRFRAGVAAVEAAVALPVLATVWLAAGEVNQLLSLRQQTQVLAGIAADKVVRSSRSFSSIEEQVETTAESLGLRGVDVSVRQLNDSIVESSVVLDFSQNSPLRGLFGNDTITSNCYSYRKED